MERDTVQAANTAYFSNNSKAKFKKAFNRSKIMRNLDKIFYNFNAINNDLNASALKDRTKKLFDVFKNDKGGN